MTVPGLLLTEEDAYEKFKGYLETAFEESDCIFPTDGEVVSKLVYDTAVFLYSWLGDGFAKNATLAVGNEDFEMTMIKRMFLTP